MKRLVFIIVSLFLFSCNNIPFNKEKWNVKDADVYYYRKDMLKDLTTNHKLVGLKYAELTRLLGEGNRQDSVTITYSIDKSYDMIDPIYEKTLIFNFNKDSVIASFHINEWRKK